MSEIPDAIRWPIPGSGGETWVVRPFGIRLEDLDMDITQVSQPAAVTAVLIHCVGSTTTDPWEWTVNRRLQGLLAVTIITSGSSLGLTRCCSVVECGEPMDLPLDLHAFRVDQDSLLVDCIVDDGPELSLRVPTGADQLKWLREVSLGANPLDDRAMAMELIATVNGAAPQVGTAVSQEWLTAIDRVLNETDFLTTLEIEARCPACAAVSSFAVDLEAELLAVLNRERPRMLDEIHRLAKAYHWNEAEIMNLPVARRREYLHRVEQSNP